MNTPIVMESYNHNPIKREALKKAVEELIEKDVLETVELPHSPGFYGRLFIRPKKEQGKWRSIIDLSYLNKYIINPSFQMESPKSIQAAMRKGLWCTSIDLKDAYFHIPIHPSYRKYMRIALLGKVLQFKAMPMGLNISARIFTKIILEVIRYLRKKGIHLHSYIDDWFPKNRDPTLLVRQTNFTVELCGLLVLLVNLIKSELEPGQRRIYVGILFDLQAGLALASPRKLTELEITLQGILNKQGATARQWASIIGKMGDLMNQIKLGPLHCRPLQWFLQSNWSQESMDWEKFIKIEDWTIPHIRWWCKRENTFQGLPLTPFKADVLLYTDASQWDYGRL